MFKVEMTANELGEVFATYYRDGEKIALSLAHADLMKEITAWIAAGKMPANGTFYRF